MSPATLQTVDLTAIVRRLEEPARGVLVRIIDRTAPLIPVTVLLALIIGTWGRDWNESLARAATFALVILGVIPVVLMTIVWRRHGASIGARLRRLEGLAPLTIDGVHYDLADIATMLKRLVVPFDYRAVHKHPTPTECVAIGALLGVP